VSRLSVLPIVSNTAPIPIPAARHRSRPGVVGLAVGLALALVVALAGCAQDDAPVLTVDGWTLSRATFTEQLQQIADNEGYIAARSSTGEPFRVLRTGTEEFDPEFVAEFLNERVTFQLATAEVAKRGLTVTDEDRQRAIDTIVAGLATGSTEITGPAATAPPGSSAPSGTAPGTNGRAVLDAFGSYRDVLIDGVANLQALQRDLATSLTGDEQLRTLYEQVKDTSGTQACARHILVQAGSGQSDATTGEPIAATEDEYVAALLAITEIGLRLQAGEDFATVAAEVSDDGPTKGSGGDLGCAPRDTYSASFDAAIWSQEVGVIGQPVRSEFGYHLILVTDRRTLTFEELRDDLRAAVDAQSSEALQGWINETTRGASVIVDPGAGTWDAENGLVKAVGAVDAAELDLAPEDPDNPSDDLQPAPSSTSSTLELPPLPTTSAP